MNDPKNSGQDRPQWWPQPGGEWGSAWGQWSFPAGQWTFSPGQGSFPIGQWLPGPPAASPPYGWPWTGGVVQTAPGWQPRLDIYRREDAFLVAVDLPDVENKDFAITWSDEALIISGTVKEDPGRGKLLYRERPAGPFYRRLPLPPGVEAKEAIATYTRGVLEIVLPFKEGKEKKTIRIDVKH